MDSLMGSQEEPEASAGQAEGDVVPGVPGFCPSVLGKNNDPSPAMPEKLHELMHAAH